MTWNYRILADPNGLALHEVYYDAAGRPDSWTAEPITFSCDLEEGQAGIIDSLERALSDARRHLVLEIVGDKLKELE